MSEKTSIHIPTGHLDNEIRALPVPQFRVPQELKWSRRTALANLTPDGVDLSVERSRQLSEFVADHTSAPEYHVALLKREDVDSRNLSLAGSGTLIQVEQHVAILSASHVFAEKGLEGDRFGGAVYAMFSNRQSRDNRGRSVPTEAVFLSGGFGPLPNREPSVEGLPDLAVFVLNDRSMVEQYKPRAFPFDEPHCCVDADDLLQGTWLITGARGELSGPGRVYNEVDRAGFVDRVYERKGMSFLSTFVDPVGESRKHRRNWGGTSGGGCWNQRLTSFGFDKLRHHAPLEREDLGMLRLAGVPFFHSAEAPQGRPDPSNRFEGELICHHLTPQVVQGIRVGVLAQADDAYRQFAAGATAPTLD